METMDQARLDRSLEATAKDFRGGLAETQGSALGVLLEFTKNVIIEVESCSHTKMMSPISL